MPTLEDYRNNSGDFAEEPAAEVQDAAVQEQEDARTEVEDMNYEEGPEGPDVTGDFEDAHEPDTDDYEDDEPELTPKEKTAFDKRLEREIRKKEEQLAKQLEEKYSKHQRVIEKLGGDPEKIEQYLEEQRIQSEINTQAQTLAYNNGWDEEQTQWYINDQTQKQRQELQQKQLQSELAELRLANQINDLRDNPDYPGIVGMKKDIADMVSKSNGNLTVSQAYWALSGENRTKQMIRETEQRAAVKRRNRVVAKDTATAASTEQMIPATVLAEAQRWGISERELRELASFDAQNINDYRAKNNKKKA